MKYLHIAAVKCNRMSACDRERHQEEDAKDKDELTYEGIDLT